MFYFNYSCTYQRKTKNKLKNVKFKFSLAYKIVGCIAGFKQRRRRRQRQRHKTKDFNEQKKSLCTCVLDFGTFRRFRLQNNNVK